MPAVGRLSAAATLLAVATSALAGGPDAALPEFAGRGLPLTWGLPFAGLILSIALFPIFASKFWHDHFGKIAALWTAAFLLPFALTFGTAPVVHHVVHALLLDYLPFIAVLFALYTVAGGISISDGLSGTPASNTALLAVGAGLASIMGTTGAAMLLIRPLLSANAARRSSVHVVVFFILLVGNVGGALSPLGDPPLFIGFLKGVDFFWTLKHLLVPTIFLAGFLLALFYALDRTVRRREKAPVHASPAPMRIDGKRNFLLIAAVIGAVLLSGIWRPGTSVEILGTPVELQNLVRDALLFALALASLAITPRAVRVRNAFSWAPIVEVAQLFVAIFLTIIPVIAILQAGKDGALADVVSLVVDPVNGQPRDTMLFWTTGLLSAFLDNAPTYLVFFNIASGDAAALMGPLQRALAAISAAGVYFGALTYVGNAPNFMIKAIAEDRNVAMPSFFGYFIFASAAMLPPLALIAWLFI